MGPGPWADGTTATWRRMALNLPNSLTLSRIAATPLICLLMAVREEWSDWLALALWIAACVTDYLDGHLARTRRQQSSLGTFLDPMADKLLVSLALLTMVGVDRITGWHLVAAAIILAREILLTGLRGHMAELNVGVPVTRLAKWKTAVQMVALGILVLGPSGPDFGIATTTEIGLAGLWAAALLTLVTGWSYLRAALAHIVDADERLAAPPPLEPADPTRRAG